MTVYDNESEGRSQSLKMVLNTLYHIGRAVPQTSRLKYFPMMLRFLSDMIDTFLLNQGQHGPMENEILMTKTSHRGVGFKALSNGVQTYLSTILNSIDGKMSFDGANVNSTYFII